MEGVGDERELKYETLFAVIRLVVGLSLFVGFISLVGWLYRDELGRFGKWFVDRFGVWGMIAGTMLADGFHFPIPPQFYLLTGIVGGYGNFPTFCAVLAGSELGAVISFSLGRRFGRTAFLERRMVKPRVLMQRFMDRLGYVGLALATLLPLSFCIQCATVGAMKLPNRALGVMIVMRVPKLLLAYVVVIWAWHL